jgi:hypothetical protein
MAEKVKVWFDPEADYLEVQFREAPGFMRPTGHDAVPLPLVAPFTLPRTRQTK